MAENYHDFVLCETNHPVLGDIYTHNSETGLGINEKILNKHKTQARKRLEKAKKIIDSESKPGDLIMIESPEEEKTSYWGKDEELAKKYWDKGLNECINFYYNLAEYAKSRGRKVLSLESGTTRSGGRFIKSLAEQTSTPELELRREYIMRIQRNKLMEAKINAKKPKLVLTAKWHESYLENMKPKKTIRETKMPFMESLYSIVRKSIEKDLIKRYALIQEKRKKERAVFMKKRKETRNSNAR
ncbi:MAG: hypothetical protein JW703_01790 [Candidatus Diapherotrites archaeon]|nr:hypothetical protein [Candidatus Diapherotrites archaeon]